MKNLISPFYELYRTNDEFKKKAGLYERALKSPDWEFLRDTILMIRGQMAIDMFSMAHTKLTSDEKDVIQRTYYNINQILDFLLNPVGWVKKRKEYITPDPRRQGQPNFKGRT